MAKSGGKAAARGDKLGKAKSGHGGHHVKKLSPKSAKKTDKMAKKGGKSKLPFGK